MVLVGMLGVARIDWTPIFVRELIVRAAFGYHRAEEFGGRKQTTFEIAFELMLQGKVNLDWMVTHTFRLNDYKSAFKILSDKSKHRIIKAAFAFDR